MCRFKISASQLHTGPPPQDDEKKQLKEIKEKQQSTSRQRALAHHRIPYDMQHIALVSSVLSTLRDTKPRRTSQHPVLRSTEVAGHPVIFCHGSRMCVPEQVPGSSSDRDGRDPWQQHGLRGFDLVKSLRSRGKPWFEYLESRFEGCTFGITEAG